MFPVPTQDLRRMVANALLFSTDVSQARGACMWILGSTAVRVVASDDYIILVDSAETEGIRPTVQYVLTTHPEMKTFSKELAAREEPIFDLTELPGETLELTAFVRHILYDADSLVAEAFDASSKPEGLQTVAVSAARLRSLARVKSGDYPIDLRAFGEVGVAGQLIAFRIGPTVRGLIAPLDREKLHERFTGEELWP